MSHAKLLSIVSGCYSDYHSGRGLRVPAPEKIRAGKAGGLPFDSLTTDLFLGCLPANRVCYGNCFAATAAFTSGVDFGTRVRNVLDKELFRSDVARLPASQRFLKNGWNSDPSWDWSLARDLAVLVHAASRHVVFIT